MKKPLVVILAGGIGKSFQPLAVNKTVLPIFGKPVLQHIIEMVEQSGFQQALVVTNSENEQWLASYEPFNILIQTKIQDKPLGMGDALLQLSDEIGTQPILVMNAVDFIDPTFLRRIYQATLNRYAFVTGLKVENNIPAGYIKIADDKAQEIIEKPAPGSEPSDMVNLVFHYFSEPQVFLSLLRETKTEKDDQYELALNKLMKQEEVSVINYDGYWQKLKFAHNILDLVDTFLHNRIKKHRAPSATVSPHAVIEGDVFIDDYAHIESFAVIKGPCYIGKNAMVGNHALVRHSVVEENAVVGFGSEVARSYIGPGCKLHKNFVGDTILERDVNPSWGTTFANYRLDKKNVKVKFPDEESLDTGRPKLGAIVAKGAFLGVNCSVMPGVTIGENATIKPGSVVLDPVK